MELISKQIKTWLRFIVQPFCPMISCGAELTGRNTWGGSFCQPHACKSSTSQNSPSEHSVLLRAGELEGWQKQPCAFCWFRMTAAEGSHA